jgi:hypothetical protein
VKTYSLEQAVCAQRALRDAAGLGPEMFPVQGFVGMISDEIEELRSQGKYNQDIATLIGANSNIQITAAEIAQHYAPQEDRHQSHDYAFSNHRKIGDSWRTTSRIGG